MEGNIDSWGIRKYSDDELIYVLRDPLACEKALTVAITEALARILEKQKLKTNQSPVISED